MSWYIGADVYKKTKNGWECLVDNNYRYNLKNLCESRSLIDENIRPCSLSDDDKNDLKELISKHDWEDKIFIGKIESVVFDQMEVPFEFDEKIFIEEKDVERVEKSCIELSDYQNLDSKEIEEKYTDVYYKKTISRNGNFYNVGSFDFFIRNLEDKLQTLNKKKENKERIENSLEYLKLSIEEKQNVMDDFDYLDEDIDETMCRLSAAKEVVSVLEFFSDRDLEGYDDMVIYLFSD